MRRTPFIPDNIGPTTKIRLEVAAAIAFPGGGVTAANLRQEARRGRLAISRIGNKDFTTLQAVDRMYEACQLQKGSGCGSGLPETDTPPSISSETDLAKRALAVARAKLSAPLSC